MADPNPPTGDTFPEYLRSQGTKIWEKKTEIRKGYGTPDWTEFQLVQDVVHTMDKEKPSEFYSQLHGLLGNLEEWETPSLEEFRRILDKETVNSLLDFQIKHDLTKTYPFTVSCALVKQGELSEDNRKWFDTHGLIVVPTSIRIQTQYSGSGSKLICEDIVANMTGMHGTEYAGISLNEARRIKPIPGAAIFADSSWPNGIIHDLGFYTGAHALFSGTFVTGNTAESGIMVPVDYLSDRACVYAGKRKQDGVEYKQLTDAGLSIGLPKPSKIDSGPAELLYFNYARFIREGQEKPQKPPALGKLEKRNKEKDPFSNIIAMQITPDSSAGGDVVFVVNKRAVVVDGEGMGKSADRKSAMNTYTDLIVDGDTKSRDPYAVVKKEGDDILIKADGSTVVIVWKETESGIQPTVYHAEYDICPDPEHVDMKIPVEGVVGWVIGTDGLETIFQNDAFLDSVQLKDEHEVKRALAEIGTDRFQTKNEERKRETAALYEPITRHINEFGISKTIDLMFKNMFTIKSKVKAGEMRVIDDVTLVMGGVE